jgi:hypothetical protein
MWIEAQCDEIEGCGADHQTCTYIHLIPPLWRSGIQPHDLIPLSNEELALLYLTGKEFCFVDEGGGSLWDVDARKNDDPRKEEFTSWLQEHNLPMPCIFEDSNG